jgi:3-oxoadipate enol-lactonase
MPQIQVGDGTELHYEVEGREDGPPLLFSHALGTNLDLWATQAQAAAGLGFRAIRYDTRGHGGSGAPGGAYTLEQLGKDVLDLLDGLSIEKAAYCGISLGGMTGVWLAMHHPRRFSRMALCNLAVWMPPREGWDDRIAAVREHGMPAVVDATIERWFTQDFRESGTAEVERVHTMLLATDPEGYAGCCAALRDMDLRDRLGLIEAPTLVVIGAHDPSTPPDRGQYLVERIPGAQKAVLETAHLSNIEAADEFNRVVLGFLSGERL